jgi:hypothetical protein
LFGHRGRSVGNQREIRQVSPREGPGVVIPVRLGHASEVNRLLGDNDEQCRFYTYFRPAGEPIEFPNLDGPDVALGPHPRDHVVIQSGGKMWCGYEAFVDRVRALAPHLEDALFFVGDEEEYIDEFRLSVGELRYRRVHEGGWRPVDEFIQSQGLGGTAAPGTSSDAGAS